MNATDEEKLEQLERILQSHAFHGAENLKSFLRYVVTKSVQSQEDHLKEYTIATEVFGRGDDFSPRSDSVVRVQAGRLRLKLQEYYAHEGQADRILIELPKGHYTPVFSYVEHDHGGSPPVVPKQSPQTASKVGNERSWMLVMGTVVVLLSVAVVLLALSNRTLRQQAGTTPAARTEGSALAWEPFLKASDSTLVVLSNPLLYRFANPMDPDELINRSVSLPPEENKRLSEVIGDTFIVRNNPAPRLLLCADEYTGMGEAIGLYRVTEVFSSAGRRVVVKQSRTVSPEDLKNHNVVLLGSVWVNEWSGKLPAVEDFTYTRNATIVNRNPRPGEQVEYGPKFDKAGLLIEDYGLVTVKPNISGKNTVMVLAGIHSEGTEAAAEYVASKAYSDDLNGRLRQMFGSGGLAKYYQILLRVAVDNGVPTTITPIAVHELAND
jgi:hypothetical protein